MVPEARPVQRLHEQNDGEYVVSEPLSGHLQQGKIICKTL